MHLREGKMKLLVGLSWAAGCRIYSKCLHRQLQTFKDWSWFLWQVFVRMKPSKEDISVLISVHDMCHVFCLTKLINTITTVFFFKYTTVFFLLFVLIFHVLKEFVLWHLTGWCILMSDSFPLFVTVSENKVLQFSCCLTSSLNQTKHRPIKHVLHLRSTTVILLK